MTTQAMLSVSVVADDPPSAWQRECIDQLAAAGMRVGRIDRIRPGAADAVIDLTAAGRVGGGRAWSLVQGDGRPLTAARPFLREWGAGEVCSVHLLDESGRRLRSAHLASAERSYRGLLDFARSMAARLPAAACRDHLRGIAPGPTMGRSAIPAAGALEAMVFAGRGRARLVARRTRRSLAVEKWLVGVADRPIHAFLDGRLPPVRWLEDPDPLVYRADPFAHPMHPGEVWWEFFDHRTGIGSIERGWPERGDAAARVELGVGVHLSFPFMTRIGDDVVLVPEMGQAGETRIYRLDEADRPQLVARLPVASADPVLFAWEGRYWLALTRRDIDFFGNLCLWYATDLAGPWTPHPGNPVKLDVRSSRSAGTPFVHGGQLFRPSMDCSQTYGGALAVNRVVVCSPVDFREEVAAVIEPDRAGPCPIGLHTLSAWGGRTLIDGKDYVIAPAGLWWKLRRRLGGLFAGTSAAGAAEPKGEVEW